MAVTSGSIALGMKATNSKTGELAEGISDNISLAFNKTITAGTGANQVNRVWSQSHNATASYDFSGTALTDEFGATISLASIKGIMVVNKGDGAITLEGNFITTKLLGGDGAATAGIVIPAGDAFVMTNLSANGWAVTNTSGDTITVTDAGSEVFDIIVIGVAA